MPTNVVQKISDRIILPMIAAPMFLVSGPELVAATCDAGVIGSFPFPNARSIEVLDEWLDGLGRRARDNPNAAPYAVNLLSHLSYDRLADELALIASHKPKIVITALGGPEPVIDTVHSYGGIVIADVNSLTYARKAIERGADGVALVCSGAGGHTGHMSAFAFVSAVRDFFDGLVVAAGSIGNGRAVRAAEVLGADLSYVGTSFIAAEESRANDEYRRMLVEARYEDLVPSDLLTGAKANYLRASLLKMGLDPDNLEKGSGVNFSNSQDQIKAWRDIWSAGHGVGEVREIRPAAAIIEQFRAEYEAAKATP
ncbi:MAG: NAD(P)H-dependent flavin oxidoreductase [Henriciella sp.]